MDEKELLSGLPPYLFGAAAAITLAIAVFLAVHSRSGATLMVIAAFLAAVLAYFPRIESVSALMVNVTLRKNIDRAEEILNKLRTLSVVNAKVAYTTLAWGNRFGSPTAAEKQRLLDAMDEQLTAMDVSANERREIKQPYVRFIAFDFGQLYIVAIDYASNRRMEALQRAFQAQAIDANRTAMQNFAAKQAEWRSKALSDLQVERIPIDGFRKYLHDRTPTDTFSPQETEALNRLADHVADLFEASKRKGGYTTDAAQFYDAHAGSGGASLSALFVAP
jgi:hypothetical protein